MPSNSLSGVCHTAHTRFHLVLSRADMTSRFIDFQPSFGKQEKTKTNRTVEDDRQINHWVQLKFQSIDTLNLHKPFCFNCRNWENWIKSLVVDRSHIKEWEIIPQASVLFCLAPIWSKSSHNASVPRCKPGGQHCAETQQQPSPNSLTEPSHETSWLTSAPPPQCFSWVRGRKVWAWTDLGDNGAAWVRGTEVSKARSPLTQGPGTNGPYRWARVRFMLPQTVWFPRKCSTNAEFWTTKKAAFKVE